MKRRCERVEGMAWSCTRISLSKMALKYSTNSRGDLRFELTSIITRNNSRIQHTTFDHNAFCSAYGWRWRTKFREQAGVHRRSKCRNKLLMLSTAL